MTSVVVASVAECVPNTKVAIYGLTGIVSSDFLLLRTLNSIMVHMTFK